MSAQEQSRFREQFTQQVQYGRSGLSLDRAALCLAGEEFPSLSINIYVNQLDDMAAEVDQIVNGSINQRVQIEGLGQYLFQDLGFIGNQVNYLNPDNCYLNHVIDSRSGIPITLSIVYLEVARRLGIRCFGIGLPGHFLVHLEELDLFLDPFNGGRLLSETDCRRLVRESMGPHFPWRGEFLARYTHHDTLYRLLCNLKNIYVRNKEYTKAAEALQRMALIYPQARNLNRDLAWCYYHTGDGATAHRYLEIYLQRDRLNQEPSELQYQVNSIWSALNSLG